MDINNNNMTITEAVEAMQQGFKVAHSYYEAQEYAAILPSGNIIFEDGLVVSEKQFRTMYVMPKYQTGWRVWNPQTK